MIKKILPIVLLCGSLIAADHKKNVFDALPEDASFVEFAAFVSQHEKEVAQDNNHISITLDLFKKDVTSDDDWLRLVSLVAELMGKDYVPAEISAKILAMVDDGAFDTFDGEVGVFFGCDEDDDMDDVLDDIEFELDENDETLSDDSVREMPYDWCGTCCSDGICSCDGDDEEEVE